MVGFDLAADGAHMSVEGAYSYDHAGRESEALCPFGGEAAGGLVAGVGLLAQAGGEALEQRIEGGEEFVRRDMEQFGPEPFGGVDAADVLQVIDIKACRMRIDSGGLFYGAVVLPEDEEGVRVLYEAGEETQGSACFVDRHGG
ncbi:hypothetical protein GP486_008873 [Trichoglossum hirsutum]|uniref:Uncharacterized protein n=1 Tax=Trichoglossum hirsutum TaxID=265104 RepID=A0A9P8L0S9_9PEZI|nr:hypothetical protein GP486_008873 [Trichoglossum hirsutum]